ncbi:MAG: FAD-binding protein, partial [Acidimicrobiales bacterium]
MPSWAGAEAAGVEDRILSGWGRTAPSGARVLSPDSLSELPPSDRGVIARGLGRSYGDAAQCAGGLVVETSRLDAIEEIDPGTGEVEVGAGVSLEALLEAALPQGWFIPVSPGTRQV